MSCVRKELLFGSELICELCKSDDSLEERRRLAEPFLRAEERLSDFLTPTVVKANAAAPPPISKIRATDKERFGFGERHSHFRTSAADKTNAAPPPTAEICAADKGRTERVCNACYLPALREPDFTKLGCCKGCLRLLHTRCSGLPSVECLEWEECAACQERRSREVSAAERRRVREERDPFREERQLGRGSLGEMFPSESYLAARDPLNKKCRSETLHVARDPLNKKSRSETLRVDRDPLSKNYRSEALRVDRESLGDRGTLNERFRATSEVGNQSRRVGFLRNDESTRVPAGESMAHATTTDPSWLEGIRQEIRGVRNDLRAELESVFRPCYHPQPRDLLADLPDPPRTRESLSDNLVARQPKSIMRFRKPMSQADDDLLDYEEHVEDIANKDLAT